MWHKDHLLESLQNCHAEPFAALEGKLREASGYRKFEILHFAALRSE